MKEDYMAPSMKRKMHSSSSSSIRKKVNPIKKLRKVSSLQKIISNMTSNQNEDEDEKEIARLEKLLGIDTSKKGTDKSKAMIDKLNKEYEMYEGIGDDFGGFLMKLDKLGDSNHKDRVLDDDFDDGFGDSMQDNDDSSSNKYLIDESEQEESDVDIGDDVDLNSDDNDEVDDGQDIDGDGETGSNDSDDEGNREVGTAEEDNSMYTYHPNQGEDIYGRSTDSSSSVSGRYIPPSKRKSLEMIDETSENAIALRRSMNGLMNKLSDQTKDTILREIKALFDKNSLTITNTILKDCIMATCSNSKQLMHTLIPVYACLISALHFIVSNDIGAYIIETLCVSFHNKLNDYKNSSIETATAQGVSDKLAVNSILLLSYLYNFRIVHHTLIMDVLNLIVRLLEDSSHTSINEYEIEILLCLVDNCGYQLRSDDPEGLKNAIVSINQQVTLKKQSNDSRIKFMLECLTDLKNNKSKRSQSDKIEAIKKHRKWIGGVKVLMKSTITGDSCLHVSLSDLLHADKRGRWWRTCASWRGNDNSNRNSNDANSDVNGTDDANIEGIKAVKAVTTTIEEKEMKKLLKLAAKLRFSTTTRKNIFLVLMSSRDITDAYERISRLGLKGKQDREIIQVVMECCANEAVYNPFYAEFASLLCSYNRQYKTTLQFAYWDFFKLLDSDDTIKIRKVVNLARLLSHLVTAFHTPLAILKSIEISSLTSDHVLFLATFFMSLLTSTVSDESFQNVLDRVATSKDFSQVRETILYFLQKHLTVLPKGLEVVQEKLAKGRRRLMITTMEAMNILEFAANADVDKDDS